MEEIDKDSLSREEYPYVKDPAGNSLNSSSSPSTRPPANPNSKPVQSRRTVGKTGGTTWASKGRASSEEGYSRFEFSVSRLKLKFLEKFLVLICRSYQSSDEVITVNFPWILSKLVVFDRSDSVLRHAVSDPKINGKRIFLFVIGGMTRSEVRTQLLLSLLDLKIAFLFMLTLHQFGRVHCTFS